MIIGTIGGSLGIIGGALEGLGSDFPLLSELPTLLDNTYNYNITPTFSRATGDLWVPWWSPSGASILGHLSSGGQWETFDLSATAIGTAVADGHNYITACETTGGRLFVSGNMHADNMKLITSTDGGDSWSNSTISGASDVTYPWFVTFSDGDVAMVWRNGGSGNGNLMLSHWNGSAWSAAATLINGTADDVSPYHHIFVDDSDNLHLFWVWRDTPLADTCHDVCYAYSEDRGATWKKMGGASQTSPITLGNADVVHAIGTDEGVINQAPSDIDTDGNVHTTFLAYDINGYTQINHLWHNGTSWQVETVTDTTTTVETDGLSLIDMDVSYGAVVCPSSGGTFILWQSIEDDHRLHIIDVSTPGTPVDHVVADVDLGLYSAIPDPYGARNRDRLRLLLTEHADTAAEGYWKRRPGWILDQTFDALRAEETVPREQFAVDTYDYEVFTDAPAFYAPLDNAARDLVKNAAPITTNAMSYVTTDLGDGPYSGDFNGSTSRLRWNYPAALEGHTNFTVEALVDRDRTGVSEMVVGRDSGTTRNWMFGINASNQVYFTKVFGGTVTCTSTGTVVDDGPHHLAATYDGSTIRLYIDGVADVTTASASGALDDGSTSTAFTIGYRERLTDSHLDGQIAGVALYGTTLSPARILAHAQVAGL